MSALAAILAMSAMFLSGWVIGLGVGRKRTRDEALGAMELAFGHAKTFGTLDHIAIFALRLRWQLLFEDAPRRTRVAAVDLEIVLERIAAERRSRKNDDPDDPAPSGKQERT